MNLSSNNAVQILLLVGGLTLVPAILFTVTGFSRILIVLGFIRSAVGTTTEPPNQVLVGIALFLTIFVMAPTVGAIKKDAVEPLIAHKISTITALERAEEPMREFMFRQTRVQDISLFVNLAKAKHASHPRRSPDRGADPGVHRLRAQDRVSDRLLDLPAVLDHRPDRLRDADEHGDDHAAADLHLAAFQDPAVRAGRRLGSGHQSARPELSHLGAAPIAPMNQDTVVNLASQAMSLALKIAGPLLLVALVAGLVVSIFQAVTQIQEQSLTLIPKIIGVAAVIVVLGPWMLGQLVAYTPRCTRRSRRWSAR